MVDRCAEVDVQKQVPDAFRMFVGIDLYPVTESIVPFSSVVPDVQFLVVFGF